MNIVVKFLPRKHQGYALIMVLAMASISLMILTATMNHNYSNTKNTDRINLYQASINAAEASTEKAISMIRRDFTGGSEALVTNNLKYYRQAVPSASEDTWWDNFIFSDAQGNVDKNYVMCISNRTYVPLQSQYYGLSAWRTMFRIVSNASQSNAMYTVTGAVQQDVELDAIPVFQFAIFFNGLLEFTWANTLTVRGRTHANGNIHMGSHWDIDFQDTVTTTGIMTKTNWGGHTLPEFDGDITYATNKNGGYSMNQPSLSLPIGTNNTPAAVREIINVPPSGESVDSDIGRQRFYNKAGMTLLVDQAKVTAVIKNSANDPSPVTIQVNTPGGVDSTASLATFPFLTINDSFYDQREGATMKLSEIDIAKFKKWMGTNIYTSPTSPSTKHPPANPLNILYVADLRNTPSGVQRAVRLINGSSLPPNPGTSGLNTGFTVATMNPLYIQGNYNCTNSSYLGTTNTSATVPASVICDALTILSQNWDDTQGAASYKSRDPANTTVNAAMISGMVYSNTNNSGLNPYSGGVVNFPRLLEDWSAYTLTLNTSIVNFYDSVKADGPFQMPGVYYSAPTRNFNFDMNFKDVNKLPPGTPLLGVLLRSKWTTPPPNTINYAGN